MDSIACSELTLPEVGTREEWLAARKTLLAAEKALTRHRDAVNMARRGLPMVELSKDYEFEGPQGTVKLIDLFEGRRQLIIYHFMFEPDDSPLAKEHGPHEAGCPGCSHLADCWPHAAHLHARDTSLVMISRAPLAKITPFKQRMGWTMPWFSSYGSDFNYDFYVTMDESIQPVQYNFQSKEELAAKGEAYHLMGEQPGCSVFFRNGDQIFHSYSTYARGLDPLLTTNQFLDLTPMGRGEGWDGMPDLGSQGKYWWKHHDKYESSPDSTCCGCSK
ncbi:DUF899 domain-containing protein [Blastopirellula sp. JC732]|uniref:DUF899 domain-containing protein n=1 Tax=Blastopirellula sediminis TaxID=2894196 RepID=A0A9X1MT81_9BACT|nr:DUF899 domain-containing protein [Blastopirellula sediminis]MCC9604532.1 DUF899 domain-containing protein [Blastopirellula sediminis]MCC9632169.1 DUF899 domain-containing protein [Blastopirellula sediminis]